MSVFKKVTREVDVFDVEKIKVGTKIKYISNDDELDVYYNYENEEKIYDWGYGEILAIDEDMIVFDYYSEVVEDYSSYATDLLEKMYKQTSVTPDMILNGGYVLELIKEDN